MCLACSLTRTYSRRAVKGVGHARAAPLRGAGKERRFVRARARGHAVGAHFVRPTSNRVNMGEIRERIIATYAEWTALSALRSGAPIKSRYDVYRVLRACSFNVLFDKSQGPMSASEFNCWHRSTTTEIVQREPG